MPRQRKGIGEEGGRGTPLMQSKGSDFGSVGRKKGHMGGGEVGGVPYRNSRKSGGVEFAIMRILGGEVG